MRVDGQAASGAANARAHLLKISLVGVNLSTYSLFIIPFHCPEGRWPVQARLVMPYTLIGAQLVVMGRID